MDTGNPRFRLPRMTKKLIGLYVLYSGGFHHWGISHVPLAYRRMTKLLVVFKGQSKRGGQMAERLENRAINEKVAGLIPGRAK